MASEAGQPSWTSLATSCQSTPSLIALALLMIPAGLPLSPWLGSLSASVQRAVPAAASTEAFTWTFAVITVGMAAGSAVGGTIIQAASPEVAFLIAGALSLGRRRTRIRKCLPRVTVMNGDSAARP